MRYFYASLLEAGGFIKNEKNWRDQVCNKYGYSGKFVGKNITDS
jgi:hypothetical protein